eukprot:SAG31_NODE_60_length_29419_cov_39.876398_31_plen_354_part_00
MNHWPSPASFLVAAVALALCALAIAVLLSANVDQLHSSASQGLSVNRSGARINLQLAPNKVNISDQYSCRMFPAPAGQHWATHFSPVGAHAARVHHMLLLGCESVPNALGLSNYRCGMGEEPPCRGGRFHSFLFGWGRGSAGFELPQGIGFRVGSETTVPYLVVQVHYVAPLPDSDSSGFAIQLSSENALRPASILLASAVKKLVVPPLRSMAAVTIGCTWPKVVAPAEIIAFRVHAHAIASTVELAVRKHSDIVDRFSPVTWETLGRRSPHEPQVFEQLDESVRLAAGDQLRVVCYYNSSLREQETRVGTRYATDEMCNGYFMLVSEVDPDNQRHWMCMDDQIVAVKAETEL